MKNYLDKKIIFTFIRCPLNKYTFSVKPIRRWVISHCTGRTLNLFAGLTVLPLLNEVRNDIDKSMVADYNMDAVDFLLMAKKEKMKFDTVILDPPYSYRKSMELYKGHKNSRFKIVKDLLSEMLEQGSKVITFGYQSVSMGSKRNFIIKEIALFSHGGAIHDTIATVEVMENKEINLPDKSEGEI